MSESRIWFMHRNGLKEGPFTLAEMMGRKKDGILRSDSQVWRDGMAGWVAASSVEEFKSGRPTGRSAGGRYKVAAGDGEATGMHTRDHEKSLVIELKRGVAEVEDQTTAIDRGMLRRAKSEAVQVSRLERKQGGRAATGVRGALVGTRSRGLGWKVYAAVAPMLAVVALSGGLRLGWIPTSVLGSGLQPVLERMFSAIPALDGVNDETLAELRAAARVPAPKVGVSVAFAPGNQGYSLYVATNLPSGAGLRVGIRGITDPTMEVTFPIQVQGHIAQSRTLQDVKGRALAAGRYQVFVVEGDDAEQSPAALARLRQIPPDAARTGVGRLPAGMPSNRRLTWVEERSVP